MYWEYTGPALANYHKTPGVARANMVAKLNDLDGADGPEWLERSAINDTYAFAVRLETPVSKGLRTTSDLAAAVKAGKKITFGCNAQFYSRNVGHAPIQEAYGFAFPREDIVRMDSELIYKALIYGRSMFRAKDLIAVDAIYSIYPIKAGQSSLTNWISWAINPKIE